MSRQVTPQTTLDNLKREAKRWLKALRANVADARVRLERALQNAPDVPTLRDVQHALALEHGLQGWAELKAPGRRHCRVRRPSMLGSSTGFSRMRVRIITCEADPRTSARSTLPRGCSITIPSWRPIRWTPR